MKLRCCSEWFAVPVSVHFLCWYLPSDWGNGRHVHLKGITCKQHSFAGKCTKFMCVISVLYHSIFFLQSFTMHSFAGKCTKFMCVISVLYHSIFFLQSFTIKILKTVLCCHELAFVVCNVIYVFVCVFCFFSAHVILIIIMKKKMWSFSSWHMFIVLPYFTLTLYRWCKYNHPVYSDGRHIHLYICDAMQAKFLHNKLNQIYLCGRCLCHSIFVCFVFVVLLLFAIIIVELSCCNTGRVRWWKREKVKTL